ncbi:Monothiol glutaredoxin-S12, chloroplastic [Gracilariopsis chorda]|uniref:Monothiol glutaredoxin-S12, chloroplastic n=1 Tax=Gracilariopsis chorda TaxID=448386 RepID=A0A2V3INR0_9FLOR|nr:Monothiol glutaredoxin-S12, chloroplastic [Gracilariopsis chorda]|eukprot:PXF43718.1 Monothiol glutaredoxin-S12, chloroplastic [Gracilariopsis chorda]
MFAFTTPLPIGTSSSRVATVANGPSKLFTPVLPRATIRRALIHRASIRAQQYGSVEDLPTEPIPRSVEELPAYWSRPGVYGVYSSKNVLQYVAAVADVRSAIANHVLFVKDEDLRHSVRMLTVDNLDQAEALGDLAEKWVITHADYGPGIPPGNSDTAPEWRKERKEENLCIPPGCPSELLEGEIENIVRDNDIVLFMKGTRRGPRCGFSAAVVDMLQNVTKDFVCVDCLDEARNPGLRNGIKQYSKWPTIPQLYIRGDFVGGHDIVRDMMVSGELQSMLETVAAEQQ